MEHSWPGANRATPMQTRELVLAAGLRVRGGELLLQARDHPVRAVRSDLDGEDDELVAADAGDEVGLAEGAA